MSSRRKKPCITGKDSSQDAIVAALRAAGATVQDMSRIGGGVPDLLVGFHGRNYLMECKPETGQPAQLRLRPSQVDWHANWQGQVRVVHTPEQALAVIFPYGRKDSSDS